MIPFLIFISIYIVGFFVTLWICHKYKNELDINHYNNQDNSGGWYGDYDSNAEAYMTFSAFWPLFWAVVLFISIYKLLLKISEKLDSKY